jgi:subtilisin-like proprotein convertase family protein
MVVVFSLISRFSAPVRPMKKLSPVLPFLFAALAWEASAAPLTAGPWRIQDGGYARDFEVALDEVCVTTHARRRAFRAIPAQVSAEAVRQYAGARRRATGERVELVLYEAGRPRNAYTRRVLMDRVRARLVAGADAAALAAGLGATARPAGAYAPDHFLFECADAAGAIALADALRVEAGVLSAEPMLARQQQKKFAPNDTLYAQQWHLNNTGQGGGTAGIDVNVTNVWDTYRGSNLWIGIVDDGLQTTHTDLYPNVNTVVDYDWNGADYDPSPDVSADYHGSSCAGVAAARGHNGRGVSGAAPNATLVGLRLIGGPADDADEAAAMSHSNQVLHIKSNSWGPADDGATLEGPGALTAAALADAAASGRGGKGVILMWAGGNGLDANDNANYDGYANSIYTIAVAALADDGTQAWYSEPGACLVVTAPSSGGSTDIVTTDLMGEDGYNYTGASGELSDKDYTKTFGGTSSATPLAAGVVALMLNANTNLGWRDVQEILIRSATKVSPSDSDWTNNSAGLHFNHKFGAGLINARAAVAAAATWTNLGPRLAFESTQTNLSQTIPDNNAAGVTRTFTLATNVRVEQVTATVDIQHASRGQIAITLTSPGGMQSRLAEKHTDSGDHYPNWTFMSERHWGEPSQGAWTVQVADRTAGTVGTLRSVRLDFHGTALEAASNQPPVLSPIGPRAVTVSNLLQFTATATDAIDGDTVRLWATNVPPWASFAGATNAGTAASVFSGTPSNAGTHTVHFFAADEDGTNAEAVVITVTAGGASADVWINELHYDNQGDDTNEGVEVAGPAGVALSSYALILYNGNGGALYSSNALSGTVDNEGGTGYGAVWFAIAGIQNGVPDGVALVKNGAGVVQFLSYEGTFTASGGPASGRTSTDIGVEESGSTPVGQSLQLIGTGSAYADFAWTGPQTASPGTLNSGQTIAGGGSQTPPVLGAIGNRSVAQGAVLEIAISATATDGDAVTLTVSNAPAGSYFSAGGTAGAFSWTNAGPIGVYTTSFHAADNDGVDSEEIAITVTPPAGVGPLDVGNWKVWDNNATPRSFTIPAGTVVDPGDCIVIGRNAAPAAFEAYYGIALGTNVLYFNAGNTFPVVNGVYTYTLKNASGATMDGPSGAGSSTGKTVQRLRADAAGTAATNWAARTLDQVAPGVGAPGNHAAGLVITEFSDATNYFYEFVELYYDASAGDDTDGDTLPDSWEIENFGTLAAASTNTDYDGDAFLDLHEMIAGTQPTNDQSFLQVDGAATASGRIVLFEAISGRTYRVEYNPNLLSGAGWSNLVTGLAGSNDLRSVPDTDEALHRLYRVGVQKD